LDAQTPESERRDVKYLLVEEVLFAPFPPPPPLFPSLSFFAALKVFEALANMPVYEVVVLERRPQVRVLVERESFASPLCSALSVRWIGSFT